MLKKAGFGLLFILAACGGDGNGGGGGGGNDPCDATTLAEFYDALGTKSLVAIDTNIENGDPATTDDTFTHEDSYSAAFDGSNSTAVVGTDDGDVDLVFDEGAGDIFDVADHETNVVMVRGDATVIIQQNCADDDDSFFISVSSGVGAPVDYFWRLE